MRIHISDEIPANLQYHRKCYQLFTSKSHLKRLETQTKKNEEILKVIIEQSNSFDSEESKPNRVSAISNSSSSILLPDKCIFCERGIIYMKRKPEHLRKCEMKQVQGTLEKCAKEKHDFDMISLLSTHDIVAAEAKYHPSCFIACTRPKKIIQKEYAM